MDAEKLADITSCVSVQYGQRLEYILDMLDYNKYLAQPLYDVVSIKSPIYIPLRSDTKNQIIERNAKWHIHVNEALETEMYDPS